MLAVDLRVDQPSLLTLPPEIVREHLLQLIIGGYRMAMMSQLDSPDIRLLLKNHRLPFSIISNEKPGLRSSMK
jgi:hypothetical protein